MPRILKAHTVYVDEDNTVQIKTSLPLPLAAPEKEPEVVEVEDDTPPEETAREVISNAENEAALIIKQANKESQQILDQAGFDAEKIKTEAEAQAQIEGFRIFEESKQEGYNQGMADAIAEGEAIKAEAQKVLDAAIRERDETRLAIEPEAVNLIIGIAEKLIGDAVEINPALVVSLIRQGFAGTTLSGQVTVRTSEADYDQVILHKEELMAAAGGTVEIEVVRDLSLGPTDCIIDTPFGGIDVSLTPQLEALRENLIFLLKNHR